MAERLNISSPEHHQQPHTPERRAHHPAERHESAHESPKKHHERLTEARESVQAHAHENQAHERLHAAEMSAAPVETPQQINRDLQSVTRRQQLNRIQRRLSPVQRVLSKVIHQPAVRAVSEATGKTVSRPSGLLGGGLVAFLGTSTYLYLAKHIGFEYNYGIFLLLFAGGFAFGVLLEFIVHYSTSSRRKLD